MASLENDLKYAYSILDGKNQDKFGFLYSRTNENLIELFKRIEVLGKEIYTHLSSSDFLFSLYGCGAKKVDCFDIQPITFRYYHLRKWLLQRRCIDADGISMYILKNIVSNHFPSRFPYEEESTIFWQKCLNKISNYHFYSSRLFEYIERPEVPYKNNLKKLVTILNEVEPIFDNIDICSNISIERTYNTIFLSNILDYNRELLNLEVTCNNLLKLLKDNGEVICSHCSQYQMLESEKDLFSHYFDYEEIFVDEKDEQMVLYYKYIKK